MKFNRNYIKNYDNNANNTSHAGLPRCLLPQKCSCAFIYQHNTRSYKLTSQLCTGPLLAVNVNINTVRMSCLPLRWVGGREFALRRQQTKTAYAKCACRQARHAPGPRLPSMRIPFPTSFMLQPAGNTNPSWKVNWAGMVILLMKLPKLEVVEIILFNLSD